MNQPAGELEDRGEGRGERFATTRWTLVVAAGGAKTAQSRQALAALCQQYWFPLYAYARRRGCSADDAEDLVQDFFAELLEKNRLQAADPQRGRFRSFLLASLNHFLANRRRGARAVKRGGAVRTLTLDFAKAEHRYRLQTDERLSPERVYERNWALLQIERSLAALRVEYERAGKLELFESLKGTLADGGRAGYRELGEPLGMSEGSVRVAAHRLRRRCREILRARIAETVEDEAGVDAELAELLETLGR